MTKMAGGTLPTKLEIRGWVRLGFLLWAVVSTAWLADSMRTRGVPDSMFRSSRTISVADEPATLEFVPTVSAEKAALIFICGSGVSAHAYAPLLRPLAESGFAVFVIKLPYRFAPFESHKQSAINRVRAVISAHPEVSHWVISGHSLGGALASRFTQSARERVAALVLIGTTHPKDTDLSSLSIPVTKVYASNDGVAPSGRVLANKHLLPKDTKWIEIRGGNHSQFGHYGRQLLDGKATISRESQQAITRAALLDALKSVRHVVAAPQLERTSTRSSASLPGGPKPLGSLRYGERRLVQNNNVDAG
jgi:pimeloyl-ACP methyl ester carboxylesterase